MKILVCLSLGCTFTFLHLLTGKSFLVTEKKLPPVPVQSNSSIIKGIPVMTLSLFYSNILYCDIQHPISSFLFKKIGHDWKIWLLFLADQGSTT